VPLPALPLHLVPSIQSPEAPSPAAPVVATLFSGGADASASGRSGAGDGCVRLTTPAHIALPAGITVLKWALPTEPHPRHADGADGSACSGCGGAASTPKHSDAWLRAPPVTARSWAARLPRPVVGSPVAIHYLARRATDGAVLSTTLERLHGRLIGGTDAPATIVVLHHADSLSLGAYLGAAASSDAADPAAVVPAGVHFAVSTMAVGEAARFLLPAELSAAGAVRPSGIRGSEDGSCGSGAVEVVASAAGCLDGTGGAVAGTCGAVASASTLSHRRGSAAADAAAAGAAAQGSSSAGGMRTAPGSVWWDIYLEAAEEAVPLQPRSQRPQPASAAPGDGLNGSTPAARSTALPARPLAASPVRSQRRVAEERAAFLVNPPPPIRVRAAAALQLKEEGNRALKSGDAAAAVRAYDAAFARLYIGRDEWEFAEHDAASDGEEAGGDSEREVAIEVRGGVVQSTEAGERGQTDTPLEPRGGAVAACGRAADALASHADPASPPFALLPLLANEPGSEHAVSSSDTSGESAHPYSHNAPAPSFSAVATNGRHMLPGLSRSDRRRVTVMRLQLHLNRCAARLKQATAALDAGPLQLAPNACADNTFAPVASRTGSSLAVAAHRLRGSLERSSSAAEAAKGAPPDDANAAGVEGASSPADAAAAPGSAEAASRRIQQLLESALWDAQQALDLIPVPYRHWTAGERAAVAADRTRAADDICSIAAATHPAGAATGAGSATPAPQSSPEARELLRRGGPRVDYAPLHAKALFRRAGAHAALARLALYRDACMPRLFWDADWASADAQSAVADVQAAAGVLAAAGCPTDSGVAALSAELPRLRARLHAAVRRQQAAQSASPFAGAFLRPAVPAAGAGAGAGEHSVWLHTPAATKYGPPPGVRRIRMAPTGAVASGKAAEGVETEADFGDLPPLE